MNAEIVAIGSELLLGQIVDTNSCWASLDGAAAGQPGCEPVLQNYSWG